MSEGASLNMPVLFVKEVTIVVMGDRKIGKSTLIDAFLKPKIIQPFKYRFLLQYNVTVVVEDERSIVSLSIFDIKDSTECDKLLQCYSSIKADAVLLCYAIDDRKSMENIKKRWIDEARQYIDPVVVILVGLRLDELIEDYTEDPVFREEGKALAKRIHANEFVQCSSLVGSKDVNNIFAWAITDSLKTRESQSVIE
ncbi:hypothetical protein NPIL_62601 [Nephila pilipes]|uniref:Uncharacterized protein n=1 Tax=Nephila pilipes TaxID=299642 RepID=A0A8X6MW84_NEPPI|nr:hypothetical protein NPIL_62601 [Nephila pilipes]